MQRLDFETNEKISRKEYLKRKKKQAKSLIKKKSKITYILIGIIVILSIYVMGQFYVYSKSNSYKYVAGDDVKKQKVYNLYYVTQGYTYNPKYTLKSINSDGFNDNVVYQDIGFTNIFSINDYIYGIKDTGLYRLNKKDNTIDMIIEKDVNKYTIYNDKIYVIIGENNKVQEIDVNTKEAKDIGIENAAEILVDNDNVYIAVNEKTSKKIYKYIKADSSKVELTKDSNVSYMIQDANNIYYVNKGDSSKIYAQAKDGSKEEKIADIKCKSDNGEIKEIDGSKYMFVYNNNLYYINTNDSNNLCKINLNDKSTSRVIQMNVEILQNIDTTVFFKAKGEMGVYLYNYETDFMSQVTSNNASEFYVDNTVIDTKEYKSDGQKIN